jgi:hypothetical protein
MTLRLRVNGHRWHAHLRGFGEREPEVMPVVKGNGYGFGFERLLAEPGPNHWADLAVGTYAEAVSALGSTAAGIVVLNPWRPRDPSAIAALASDRLMHTLSRTRDVAPFAAAAERAGGARVALEVITDLRRHGITLEELPAVALALRTATRSVTCTALALHHPIDRRPGSNPVEQTINAVAAAREAGIGTPLTEVLVSHLSPEELAAVRRGVGDVRVRPRVGTALWLGDPGAYVARGMVLDVHALARGERYGYRQRRAPADGSLVIVGGGTAHGIGLVAPTAPRGLARIRSIAIGGLSASGLALSPFRWAGRKRWFAEPPHMQVSLIFLPASVPPPSVGDELDVDVRMTTAHFDAVLVE